jgi:hypothetical protein
MSDAARVLDACQYATSLADTGTLLYNLFAHANQYEDVRNITHVFNYDYPNNSEDYIHRIGRTGRAGQMGTAITLFTTDSKCSKYISREDVADMWIDQKQARDLVNVLTEAKQQIDPRLIEMTRYGGGGGGGRYGGGGWRGGRGGGRGGKFKLSIPLVPSADGTNEGGRW